ncbi:MAG: hypothetical protein OEL89_01575 [Candidatus Peregrinibacteria bacterium]|nr:hypothetical protein [Candidatus Peregrinibacteria bacterium]
MAEQQAQAKPEVAIADVAPKPAAQAAGDAQSAGSEKNMKWWMWLIIAVVVIGAGFGLYSLLM